MADRTACKADLDPLGTAAAGQFDLLDHNAGSEVRGLFTANDFAAVRRIVDISLVAVLANEFSASICLEPHIYY